MRQDGSQYDLVPCWDVDTMLDRLQSTLDAAELATGEERQKLLESAGDLNRDLVELHGIDLGPF